MVRTKKPVIAETAIALDTECTGLDLFFTSKPFIVTICGRAIGNVWWEWDVNPETRQPVIPPSDLAEIQKVIDEAPSLILQNAKFDYQALQTIFQGKLRWDWAKVYDTMYAGHILASNQQPRNLASMVLRYVGVDIRPYEKHLEAATRDARRLVQQSPSLKSWCIAEIGLPELPSLKPSDIWKSDAWLPKAVFCAGLDVPEHWQRVAIDYANADSAATLALFTVQERLLHDRGLWEVYLARQALLPAVVDMEHYGVTFSEKKWRKLLKSFSILSETASVECLQIAKEYNYSLILPLKGTNDSLYDFVFNHLKLPVVSRTKKYGSPSINQEALNAWQAQLPEGSLEKRFIDALIQKQRASSAIIPLKTYWYYRSPVPNCPGWYLLHPQINPTATDTLRWSVQNPNSQNISHRDELNLRKVFGPIPKREWWIADYENLELRIPAYEADEKDVLYVFEHPNEPPYFGSYHLLVARLLHPKEFEQFPGRQFKEVYEASLYRWVKNGNFAILYGASEKTADRAYRVKGAYRMIQKRFPRIAAFSQKLLKQAERNGYVETIPDAGLGLTRGYPLACPRTPWGKIRPTTPLNYHVQGTAMWIASQAVVKCFQQIQQWRQKGFLAWIPLFIHDEIVFDFPYQAEQKNRTKVEVLKRLMEQAGKDVGIPTPVTVKYLCNEEATTGCQ